MALTNSAIKLIITLVVVTFVASTPGRKDFEDARNLVAESSWGVACNLDSERDNAPFGNVVSYSDGGKGTPYMLLTLLDQATAKFASVDNRTSLTISQSALGYCQDVDPQEPTCVKVTLLGRLDKVDPYSEEGTFAMAALLKQHPRFTRLPKLAMFELYKLDINAIFLINSYLDSPKYVPVTEYFNTTIV